MFKKKQPEVFADVIEGLQKLYKNRLLPLEEEYRFHDFHSPPLEDPDFSAKPMILLIGQYSTGKTTFIRYLLGSDFPGIRIGPEPTTDKFIVIANGEQETVIPGNALVVDPKRQFRPLSRFGNQFLNRLQCSVMQNQLLESLTFVDSPGILSGEKQRINRGYNFGEVLEWFAERADRIILLFDAHKLDISDEFKEVIERMRAYDEKVRVVLNKADRIDTQQLMRVYGALMWSLGKVLRTPEVTRVYIGTFWDQQLFFDENRKLFSLEEADLFHDLQMLPRNSTVRKLNDLIRRARLAKVHAFIIHELKSQMPSMFGKEAKKKELIAGLENVYKKIQQEHQIAPGDFPRLDEMREKLATADFTKFHSMKPKLVKDVDKMLSEDIARLMSMVPQEEATLAATIKLDDDHGGAFASSDVFGVGKLEGLDYGREQLIQQGDGGGLNDGAPTMKKWVVDEFRADSDRRWDEWVDNGDVVDGKVSGAVAKNEMLKSKLPNNQLGKIWKLSDVDKDGLLDRDEFALCSYLIHLKLEGNDLPTQLPLHLVPPSKNV